ncbi:MAG: BatD family protein [Kiritimatiellia bacterium]
MKALGLLVLAAFLPAAAEQAPAFEIVASSTNLVLTEHVAVTLRLRLPPLAPPHEDQAPILSQRAPHLEAAFLEQGWATAELVPVDARRLFSGSAGERRRSPDAPAFSVNDYMANDVFASMPDPFGLFDDDAFGRTMLGPRLRLFAFDVARESRNGTNGWLFTATLAPWRAVAAGTVKPLRARFRVPHVTGVKAGHDRFGRPVNQVRMGEIVLEAQLPELAVTAPPAATRPASFCGAIASNFTVRATLDTNVCTAGDPLVLTLDVAGATDASMVHPPSFAEALKGSVFRLDESSAKTDTFAGFRRFTWRVRPTKAGTVEFPALPVAYFDLATRAYATCRTEAIPIQVKAGAQATLGALGELEDDAAALPLPDGLELSETGGRTLPLLPRLRLSAILFLVPPAFVLLLRLLPPVRRYLVRRNNARRTATAFARCQRVLLGGREDRKIPAVRRFLAVRYGVNGAAVTAADAERLMRPDYSPEQRALVVDALTAQERTAFSARTTIAGLLLALALLLPAATAAADADFTYRRAVSLATRAAAAADFEKAAAAYRDCLARGADTPALLADLGTCALMAGQPRLALAAFGCLERRTGETASSRRGIQAARARLRNDPRADLPLSRFFARPHYLFTLDARLLAAAAAWAVLWFAALLPPGRCRRILFAAALAVFLGAGISAATSLVEEHVEKGMLVHVAR